VVPIFVFADAIGFIMLQGAVEQNAGNTPVPVQEPSSKFGGKSALRSPIKTPSSPLLHSSSFPLEEPLTLISILTFVKNEEAIGEKK
jgi:hypothetical protein